MRNKIACISLNLDSIGHAIGKSPLENDPTFNIVFEYEFKDYKIKHFDLYRLKNDIDINNIGLFEDIDESILLIEWPELIKKKPQNRLDLFFKYTEDYNERNLIIKTNGRFKAHEF